MARSHGIIGIDLGTDTVKAVLLEVVKGEDLPRVVGVSAVPSQGMRKGVVLELESVAAALREAVDSLYKTAEIKSANCYVGVGGVGLGYQKSRGLVAVSRADGEVSTEDARRAIAASESNLLRVQNRDILHKIPLSYRVDNDMVVRDPVGLNGIKLEAESFFITAFSHNIKDVMQSFDGANLEVGEIVANPLALAHSVVSKREKEVGVMIIDLGASTTSFVIFEEGAPYSLEVVPWGSAHITNDIATGFQITLDEAEKLKVNYGSAVNVSTTSKKDELVYGNYSKRKLNEIIEARLEDIFDLAKRHLKKVDRMGLLPAGIVIVGGAANLNGITEFAKEYLKLPTRVASPENLGGYKDKVNNPAWASAVGVALMGIAEEHGNMATGMMRGKSGMIIKWFRAFLP